MKPRPARMPGRPAVLATVALLAAGALALLAQTFAMPPSLLKGYPGDAFFPRLVIAALLCFLALLALRDLRRGERKPGAVEIDFARLGAIIGVTLAFIVALTTVGFEAACIGFLLILLSLRHRVPLRARFATAAAVAAATAIALYLIFAVALHVHLPLAVLPNTLR